MTITTLLAAGMAAGAPAPDADLPVWPFAVGTIVAVAVVAFRQMRRRP